MKCGAKPDLTDREVEKLTRDISEIRRETDDSPTPESLHRLVEDSSSLIDSYWNLRRSEAQLDEVSRQLHAIKSVRDDHRKTLVDLGSVVTTMKDLAARSVILEEDFHRRLEGLTALADPPGNS